MLALGDSVARGWGAGVIRGIDGTLDPVAGQSRRGYVQRVADDRRQTVAPRRLHLVSLANGGATLASLIKGSSDLPAQLEPALALIAERRADDRRGNDVRTITLTVGGNDVFRPALDACLARGPECQPSVQAALRSFERRHDLRQPDPALPALRLVRHRCGRTRGGRHQRHPAGQRTQRPDPAQRTGRRCSRRRCGSRPWQGQARGALRPGRPARAMARRTSSAAWTACTQAVPGTRRSPRRCARRCRQDEPGPMTAAGLDAQLAAAGSPRRAEQERRCRAADHSGRGARWPRRAEQRARPRRADAAPGQDLGTRRRAGPTGDGPVARGERAAGSDGGDWERFARHADALLDDRESFVAKAIGWVLRDTGRRRPVLVQSWLEPRAARAARVTLTKAVKPLPPEVAHRLLRL